MVIIRATAALLQKLGAAPDPQPGTSTTALGTWFATMLRVRRGRYVLAISGETMLPVVVLGRDLGTLASRLATGAAEVLAALGVPSAVIERERLEMIDARYAPTNDRSTVGVLTDLRRLLRYELEDAPTTTLLGMSLRLARTPIVARKLIPDHATRGLFEVLQLN